MDIVFLHAVAFLFACHSGADVHSRCLKVRCHITIGSTYNRAHHCYQAGTTDSCKKWHEHKVYQKTWPNKTKTTGNMATALQVSDGPTHPDTKLHPLSRLPLCFGIPSSAASGYSSLPFIFPWLSFPLRFNLLALM